MMASTSVSMRLMKKLATLAILLTSPPFLRELLQAGDVGFRHLLVDVLREEQGDVDVDAFADGLLECRDAFGRAGNLDHYILATDGLPQPARFFERALGVAGEIGRDFEADVAVAALRAVVHRPQNIGGILNVADGENFVAPLASRSVRERKRVQQIVVKRAAGDGLLEDGRVGGHAAQAVFVDQALQFAAGEQVAADVVQPD